MQKTCTAQFFFFAIYFALLLFAVPGPAYASSYSATDIMVVYNRNLAASTDVADYYMAKRGVPDENRIGLDLPDNEFISRQDFEAAFYATLPGRIRELRKQGRNPVILLVYGVPLRVGKISDDNGFERARRSAEKVKELSGVIASLVNRLDLLSAMETGQDRLHAVAGPDELPAFFKQVTAAMVRATQRLTGPAPSPEEAAMRTEIQSILFRLTGPAPILMAVEKEAAAENVFVQKDNLVIWSGIVNRQLAHIPFQGVPTAAMGDAATLVRVNKGLIGELRFWAEQREVEVTDKTGAAVDSELSLLLAEPFLKARWLPNPFLDKYDRVPGIEDVRGRTIPVARLDGPTPAIAKRLVDDALWAEAHGLTGTFYIDARGLQPKKNNYYGLYDEHLRHLAGILQQQGTMPVVLNDDKELFAAGTCPEAALYCGWYSLRHYIAAFKWQRGAVAFHVASGEASTLREAGSQVWCKRMLEEGVAATLGPVNEPYLQSFPLPDVFFPLLLSGRYPLIEVYYRSTPFLSWQQVLIGDPLYTPFRQKAPVNK